MTEKPKDVVVTEKDLDEGLSECIEMHFPCEHCSEENMIIIGEIKEGYEHVFAGRPEKNELN